MADHQRAVLTCVKCGRTARYSTDERDDAAWTCSCGGRLHHVVAFRLGAWKLRTRQTEPCITGPRLDKPTLYRRMGRGNLQRGVV